MNVRLLREFVELLLLEKIRSTKGISPYGNKFNMKKFASLGSIYMLDTYANSYLEFIGQGSSRTAYLMSSRYVLKIARNEKGIAQNEAEIDVYTNPTSKPIVSKIHNFDPEFKWVIADLVRPFKTSNKQDEDEFENGTGISWDDFYYELKAEIEKKDVDLSHFTQVVIATMEANDLLFGDVANMDHWGKTPDGKVVLLDYGFTNEVWKKHYKQPDEEVDSQAVTANYGESDSAVTKKF